MKFIGQAKIWKELGYIIPKLKEGSNTNILLKASSGYGKTRLASMIAYKVDPDSFYYTLPPSNEEEEVKIDKRKRIIIIDEVHLLKTPEPLYPLMDSGKFLFIICTNESGRLKEPLVRRCIQFIFEEYSIEEMEYIIKDNFTDYGLEVNEEVCSAVAKNANLSPGIAVKLVERLYYIFSSIGIPTTGERTKEIIKDILNIEDGLTPEHRKYLAFLRDQERASLGLLVSSLGMDTNTITQLIEPVLIKRGLIKLTSRGRMIR
jgi:Holliday junction DNA helicase RuvB